MGKLKARLADCQISKYQHIQIQRSRSVANAGGPVAAKLMFDAEEAFEQCLRVEAGLKGDDRVQKMRLIGEAHRLGGIERRARYNATERFEARGGSGQRSFGRTRAAGQVCPHSDVGGLHTIKTIAAGRDQVGRVPPHCLVC